MEEFSPEDVPESLYVEVTIPITSAMDKTQQIIFARQALDPPQLLSRETLWDDVLDVQDSEQEYARIIQDETLEDPVVKRIMVIEQLRKREQLLRSRGNTSAADALNRHIMMIEMELGMRQGIPQAAGAGTPSNVMPAEATNSPDMERAARGIPPPNINRRPKIVSPGGQSLVR